MPKTISAATLPQLHITEPHEQVLRQLSARLEREIVGDYEQFLFHFDGYVDAQRWKHERSKDSVNAFVERKSALKRDLELVRNAPKSASKIGDRPQALLAVESQLRRVLATGLVAGSLDDIMFGSTFQDTEEFQASWAIEGSVMEESAVLAKIEGASVEDPYRFLGVTWFLRTFGLPNAILKRRDLLTLTDVHLSTLSNGDRIGISVAHSIQHPDLGELHEFSTIRATSSVLRVFRQYDDRRVEVFMIHFLDTKGLTPEAFNLKESVGYMLPSAGHLVDGGFRKKLHWMVRHRKRTQAKQTTHSEWIEPASSGANDQCEFCERKIGALFSCPGTSCQLCLKRVCFRCSVPQDLPQSSSEAKKTNTKTGDFCIDCMLQAKTLSTFDVALDERRHRRGSSTSSRSASRTDSSSSSEEPRRRALTMLTSSCEHYE